MDALEAWLTSGESNTMGLFLHETSVDEGWAAVTRDGEQYVEVQLSAPFLVRSRVLDVSTGLMSRPVSSLPERLDQICAFFASGVDDGYGGGGSSLDTVADDETPPDEFASSALTSAERREAMRREAQSAFDTSALSKPAIDRILSDLIALRDRPHDGWTAAPRGRSLAVWDVALFDFDVKSPLQADLNKMRELTGSACVHMEMRFPSEYPFKPPFLRVVRPRFQFRTGRVTVGGSICTELLDEGWSPTYDAESLIVSIRSQIGDIEAGARLDFARAREEYTESEARDAFARVAEHHRRHGW